MFKPWVGTQYRQSGNAVGGRRLLVLGESHYGDPEHPEQVNTCDAGMTRWVVENMALSGSHPFFRNLTHLIAGRPQSALSADERATVWQSIVFYNYVPVIVATKPGVAPSQDMFEAGREPFLRVLEEHEPEAIIVCGHRLWTPMINGLPDHLRDDAKGQPFRQVGQAIAARMKHPSRYFSARDQHESVTRALFDRVDAARARSAI